MSTVPTKPATTPDGDELNWLLRQIADNGPPSRAVIVRRLERGLHDQAMRATVLTCFGERCQVVGCPFTANAPQEVVRYVLEAHHLKCVVRNASDFSYNFVVLCASHYNLCKRASKVKAVEVPGTDDVLITYEGGAFLIERDLTPLRDQLEKERQA